jgi:hypothetical protein
MDLTNSERLNLKKLINEMDCENNTEHIRKTKHSMKIRDDIKKMVILKQQNALLKSSDPDAYKNLIQNQCSFLYANYTDIFNKVLNDEIDLNTMTDLLIVLKSIEDGKVDQHEGSVVVGKILKKLYLDAAVRHGENLDREYASQAADAAPKQIEHRNISWKQFKAMK